MLTLFLISVVLAATVAAGHSRSDGVEHSSNERRGCWRQAAGNSCSVPVRLRIDPSVSSGGNHAYHLPLMKVGGKTLPRTDIAAEFRPLENAMPIATMRLNVPCTREEFLTRSRRSSHQRVFNPYGFSRLHSYELLEPMSTRSREK